MTHTSAGTGTGATRLLGIATIVAMAALALFGLFAVRPDINQRDAARLLFVHVPAAEMAYVGFAVTAVCSSAYLWKRTRSAAWDRIAGASAELATVFTGLTLVTGMLWGRVTWGEYWAWDARLTSTLLLFVMFLGYLAVRQLDGTPEMRAKRSAVVALVAVLDVPIVHFSVQWWRTLHQSASLTVKGALEGNFRFGHFIGLVAFLLAYVWLLMHRNRVLMMEAITEGRAVEVAIAERLEEARA